MITYEVDGAVAVLGLNRPEKRNAFSFEMLQQLSAAMERADADPAVRVMVLHAHGPVFTAGLDILDVFPRLAAGGEPFSAEALDPWATFGLEREKPLVCAVHGRCLTLGIELMLASDIAIASRDATFAQIEIARGLFPFGGGTARWVQTAGWGNAMRYLLTGDDLDAAEAHRLGLVQEVVDGDPLAAAIEIARRIATQAPLGVLATLRSARLALREGERAAARRLLPEIRRLAATRDVQEGVAAFVQRRPPVFHGE
jgi:enoyl-CoA hydratase/carnithine racemase